MALSRLFDFTPSTTISSSEVDSEFNQLVNLLNGVSTDKDAVIRISHATLPVLKLDQTGAGPIALLQAGGITKIEVNNSGQLDSKVATGTAPFVIASTTVVLNLNADLLDGKEAAAFALLSGATFTGAVSATELQIGGVSINIAGTLTNVAYENQGNIFTVENKFNAGIEVGTNASAQGLIEIFADPTTGLADIFFSDTVNNRGVIRYEHANDKMELWTAAIERLSIDSSGLVGINKSSSIGAQLHVGSGAAARPAAIFDTAASPTKPVVVLREGGADKVYLLGTNSLSGTYHAVTLFDVNPLDNGTGVGWRGILRRNSNVSTPAAGHLVLESKGGQAQRLWPDADGLARIGEVDPTSANDLAGTVVGDQTSITSGQVAFSNGTTVTGSAGFTFNDAGDILTVGVTSGFIRINSTDGSMIINADSGNNAATIESETAGRVLLILANDANIELGTTADVIPSLDNTSSLGVALFRWADVRSVLVNGADIGFHNGWRFRELGVTEVDLGYERAPKGMKRAFDAQGKPKKAQPADWFLDKNQGLVLMDDDNNVITVFHKNGKIYAKDPVVLSLAELPIAA